MKLIYPATSFLWYCGPPLGCFRPSTCSCCTLGTIATVQKVISETVYHLLNDKSGVKNLFYPSGDIIQEKVAHSCWCPVRMTSRGLSNLYQMTIWIVIDLRQGLLLHSNTLLWQAWVRVTCPEPYFFLFHILDWRAGEGKGGEKKQRSCPLKLSWKASYLMRWLSNWFKCHLPIQSLVASRTQTVAVSCFIYIFQRLFF